jgi:hypothetical protein
MFFMMEILTGHRQIRDLSFAGRGIQGEQVDLRNVSNVSTLVEEHVPKFL